MVIDNNSRSLQLAATSWCFPGPFCGLYGAVVSGVGEAVFNGGVHPIQVGFLNGAYGLHLTKSAPTPATSIEVWNFDGAGNVTLSGTFVGPGPTVQSGSQFGTYSVNPDGTGTIIIPPQNGEGQKTWVFVIANGHAGLLVLQRNRAGDGVLYGTGSHQ